MHVPFHRPYITDDELNAVADSIRNGWLTMGKKTFDFENNFGNYVGSKYSVAVNSCTAAMHLALKCFNIQPDDEVIIPAVTFTATADVPRFFGAKVVMTDVEKDTHLMSVESFEKAITKKTKAVIPVHYAGQPCDMDEIMAISRKHGIAVIEDAAHSLPSRYKGKLVGSIGDITCFSFYATKTLTTGEGGMATTENPEWDNTMRILRLHGISRDAWKRYSKEGTWEYDVIDAGYKYNTTDINSAMGLEQLKKVDYLTLKRKIIADKYNKAFENDKSLILYKIKPDRETAYHLYPLKLNLESLKIGRNEFYSELKKREIDTSVHFIPVYRFSYYAGLGFKISDYPDSEWIFERNISLPIFPGMKDEEINYVIENVLDILTKNRR